MLGSKRFSIGASLFACALSALLMGVATAQSPGPGTGPGGPGSGPGPGPGGPGGGPGGGTPSPTFTYTICNKANRGVAFVATVSVVGQQFRAQGWTQVPPGQCVSVGQFQRPNVWWHARSPSGASWGNSDVDLCVNFNSGFDYSWDGSPRTCGQGETAVGFDKVEIKPQFNATTMNLNP